MPILPTDKIPINRNDIDYDDFSLVSVHDADALQDKQQALLDYFEKKTGGKRLPSRDDLNPAELISFLPNLILYDLVYDEEKYVDAVYRLVGTAMVTYLGEYTGQSISELAKDPENGLNPKAYERFQIILGHVLEHKAPVTSYSTTTVTGQFIPPTSTLTIPLSSDTNKIDKLLMFIHLDQGAIENIQGVR